MNRILKGIKVQQEAIDKKIAAGELTEDALDRLDNVLNMACDEFVEFQELKSLALIEGTLTQEEAQTIYYHLGETPEHFNKQSLAIKATLTKAFQELMKHRIEVLRGETRSS